MTELSRLPGRGTNPPKTVETASLAKAIFWFSSMIKQASPRVSRRPDNISEPGTPLGSGNSPSSLRVGKEDFSRRLRRHRQSAIPVPAKARQARKSAISTIGRETNIFANWLAGAEAVADAPDSLNAIGEVPEFFSDPLHVGIEGAGHRAIVISPNFTEEVFPLLDAVVSF